METPDWKETVARWRRLSGEEKKRIRFSRIPRKVARSMAFEGHPVDENMLEAELAHLIRQTTG